MSYLEATIFNCLDKEFTPQELKAICSHFSLSASQYATWITRWIGIGCAEYIRDETAPKNAKALLRKIINEIQLTESQKIYGILILRKTLGIYE